jgi:hypothetical protein
MTGDCVPESTPAVVTQKGIGAKINKYSNLSVNNVFMIILWS